MLIITAFSRVCTDLESNAIRHASVEKQIPVTTNLVTISFAFEGRSVLTKSAEKQMGAQSQVAMMPWMKLCQCTLGAAGHYVTQQHYMTQKGNSEFFPPSIYTFKKKGAYAWKRFGKGRYIQTYVLFWKGKARAIPNLHIGNCFL